VGCGLSCPAADRPAPYGKQLENSTPHLEDRNPASHVEPSPSGREKAPGLRDPFEVMFTPILELQARASDKVFDSA
jgi:hypothetical protein